MTDVEEFAQFVQERIDAQHRREAERLAIPPELVKIREYARRAIAPIRPTDDETEAEQDFLFKAQEIKASENLPPYYLIYFLFVELLGFKDLGRFEKIAWSVPIDYKGRAYLIEHRKFGVGVFARSEDEEGAAEIVKLIAKGVKVARPFFRWLAEKGIQASKLNVVNNSAALYGRYKFMRSLYERERQKLIAAHAQHAFAEKQRTFPFTNWQSSRMDKTAHWRDLFDLYCFPWVKISKQVSWLALGAIDAFFAWTEHVFIHLAIIQGKITTGNEVTQLMGAEWNIKFKAAFDIGDKDSKQHLDRLITLRQQLRNFVAHGAFGKEGEAFQFHSMVGAIPVVFDPQSSRQQFSLPENMAFNDEEAIAEIERFINHLWAGAREPARHYIQDSDLSLILTMAQDGRYAAAMKSCETMDELVSDMLQRADAFTNMDW